VKSARGPAGRSAKADEAPGFAVRRVAAEILEAVLRRHRALDEVLEATNELAVLPERDRALTRAIVASVLRRLGTLRHLLDAFLDRGLPAQAPHVETALLLGAAQILFLNIPDHAAVDLSVRLAQTDRRAAGFASLVNAVLRRVTREGAARLAAIDSATDTPDWLLARWIAVYGEAAARAIAAANRNEPALDLTVRSDPELWAQKLGGHVLPTRSVRLIAHGVVSALPGFAEGAWWVQDAAASLPVRLLGNLAGRRVADLCAAPGGKTAQLALGGAVVTAVDRAAARLERLRQNLARLRLHAEIVLDTIEKLNAEPFDAVLLDAPCSSTGTIRRHPDVAWLKSAGDIVKLSALQRRLLDHAAALVKPGGTLVYCTCSLEPEENEELVTGLLAREPRLRRAPIGSAEVFGCAEFISKDGDLRTLPCHFPHSDSRLAGIDGFYAARLVKQH
jgi:16S rRNA (cytosine967-C5)-methyltransferase